MPTRRIIFVSVVFLSIAVFSVQTLCQATNTNRTDIAQETENSKFITNIVESLNINWSSIEYKKTLYNPALTSNKQGQPKAEGLSLSIDIEMPESGLILETCPDAVIEQITDRRGKNIESGSFSSRSSLTYVPSRRFLPIGQPNGPEHHTLRVGLDAGLLEQINGEIGIKGYFYALTAESLEYVELPFKPSDKWVRLTPDVEVRLREARNEASMYNFHIEQRPEIITNLSGVRIGDYLPSRLVACRQTIVQASAAGVGGEGSGSGTGIGEKGSGIGRAEKIRYTIAVNPAHQIIPFKIERIPLSATTDLAKSQMHASNQMPPIKRQMQNRTRRSARNAAQGMPEQVKPQFNEKVADCFEVNWSSIIYRKTLYNPAVYRKSRDRRVSEKLSVQCEAKILDPKMIIGTCNIPVVEQITDGKGRNVDISRTQSRSNRMYYRSLQYQPSLIPSFPSGLIYWEGRARLALGLPLKARHLPKRASVLQPIHMGIHFDPGLLRRDTDEIGSIKGYFHALTAGSSKHVEIPFKSDNKWVRLTSNVEIQVRKAWHMGTMARFDIRQRGQNGAGSHDLFVGDSLPDGIVMERQFIGKSSQSEPPIKFGHSLPGSIGGSGGSDIGQQIEKIDYLIAVDPNHNRIPFKLEHIPLPKP